MNAKVFIDTNILVYCNLDDEKQSHKRKKAIALLDSFEQEEVIISVQVLNELYNVLVKNSVDDSVIQRKLQDIINEIIVHPITITTLKKCWKIRTKYKYSYYDCMIIAAALEAKCRILYTEDLQNNQRIEGSLLIKNPFL